MKMFLRVLFTLAVGIAPSSSSLAQTLHYWVYVNGNITPAFDSGDVN